MPFIQKKSIVILQIFHSMYSEGISFLTFVNETLSLLYVNLAPGLENKIGYIKLWICIFSLCYCLIRLGMLLTEKVYILF